ncbi:hypothetical protein BUALT_Bualt07G0002800 [Buddleja alternifolia]|uniref:Uncharacterized protein n=1 Tax=Buddleja alternifolia TaxID=168488 RepID=A0AAV6XES5_9LAMI|nr:hypothetical protein BUALT_Bualt07G0002800 [Buddleja alternifolia]
MTKDDSVKDELDTGSSVNDNGGDNTSNSSFDYSASGSEDSETYGFSTQVVLRFFIPRLCCVYTRQALADEQTYTCALAWVKIHPQVMSLGSAAQSPSPVLDIAGNKLRAGTDYYMLPVIRGRGGGLTLASTGNKTCPLGVVQEQFEVKNGLPLTFTPVNSKKGVIRVSTDQNIKFSAASTCVQSTVWKLDYDESIGKYFVMTGGVEGNPGRETISNWFKIEEYEGDYKLFFCPTVCNFCKVICRNVGIFLQDGKRRLGVSLTDDVPFRMKMNDKATIMLLFMLLLSSLPLTIAVPSSRSLRSMTDDDNIYNQGKILYLFDEFQQQKMKGRMEMEVYDYSGPGSNNHHDPKSPPGGTS